MISSAYLCAAVAPLAIDAATPADTLRSIDLTEAIIVGTPKETMELRELPTSVTLLGPKQLEQRRVQSIKGVSSVVPNFFIPEYGSHLTTAAYVRGIGSRINTPAVGLYVDNIPFVDKSAFDFALYDVQRIDVLRGPQSTLYGRNAMGGLVRIYTKNPFDYEGFDVNLSAGTYNNYKMSATHYHRVSDQFAFSGSVGYSYKGGYFKNDVLDERVDDGQNVAARWRGVYRPSDKVSLDFHTNYEYTDEGGYPYFFQGWDSDAAQQKDYFLSSLAGTAGTLAYNRRSSYKRHLLNTGVSAEHRWPTMVLTNLVGFQWLKDDMMMDQDFTPLDVYTLRQRQNTKTVSDEIALKSQDGAFSHWEWTSGATALYQHSTADAPVTFCKDGIGWLNGMMNTNANRFMPDVQAGPMTMKFNFADNILGDALAMNGLYKTPMASAAVFHQSRIKDLFVPGLSLTLGARLDYERLWFDYACGYAFQHEYALSGHLTMPGMERDIPMVPAATYDAETHIDGSLVHDYLQFLPKASLMYEFGNTDSRNSGNVYATVSRGFRSGGYNMQMFSEVMQGLMTADIMTDVRDVTVPVLEAQPAVPAATKAQVSGILNAMAARPDYDADALTRYNPEYAWNYEVGTHLNLFDRRLQLDLAGFYIDITDQQLSRMSQTGFGRITVNAGRSYSTGLEASVVYRPRVEGLLFRANYGYTLAKFRDYDTVDSNGKEVDYSGNYVPFVPQHTVSASGEYTWNFDKSARRGLNFITLALDYTGAGSIYWTESNSRKQPFYNLLGANLTFGLLDNNIKLTLWAHNLTDTKYDTFYFETMHRGFAQHARPMEAGIDVKFHF